MEPKFVWAISGGLATAVGTLVLSIGGIVISEMREMGTRQTIYGERLGRLEARASSVDAHISRFDQRIKDVGEFMLILHNYRTPRVAREHSSDTPPPPEL